MRAGAAGAARLIAALALFAICALPPSRTASPAPPPAARAVAVPPAPAGLQLWWVDVMARVGQDDPAAPASAVAVSAARGEFEPFQVVIRAPAGGLTRVDVAVTDLVGPGGSRIPAEHLPLFLERYVHVPRSTTSFRTGYRPLPPGWFADGLIPFIRRDGSRNRTAAPFGVAGGKNQPVWVDLFVPRGRGRSPPGLYQGSLTVTADQGSATLPISLTVWDFELPVRPSLKSCFGINNRRMDDAAEQELLVAHKLMPAHLSARQVARQGRAVNATGLPFFSNNGSLWDRTAAAGKTMDPPPPLGAVEARVATFPPDLDLYQYVADEIVGYTAIFPTVRAWARVFHATRARTLVTVPPMAALLHENEDGTGRSAVDIWVMLPVQFQSGDPATAEALAGGNELWSYNTLAQDDYSPKWQIDYLPIGWRLQPGFISQSLGLKGILYWTVDRWANADYWADPYYYEGNDRFAGDGTLIYPPRTASFDTGVGSLTSGVPSMRLKWLREGVEDYEYVQLLKNLGRGEFALQVARSVGASWRSWTRSTAELLAARERLGRELDRLHGAPAAPPAPALPR